MSLLNNSKQYKIGTLEYTKAGLTALFLWLVWGDFCFVLMESVVPSILPLELKGLGASNSMMGLILITVPMVINTILNPVVSFKSDRFRSRWGRRIPFMTMTMLPLVGSMVLLGFGKQIGFFLHGLLGSFLSQFTANEVAVGTIGVIMVVFSFFNSFINAVFWYLFNDVVPEVLMARWMSCFRTVSTLSASIYNFFIFQFAESHAVYIFLGGGVIYLLGFGFMFWKVKEGEYPPPPPFIDRKGGVWSGIKTFGVECHQFRHYILIYGLGVCMAGGYMAADPFTLFFYQSCGLNLHQIGIVRGTMLISFSLFILASGWLADRYHPIRVVLAGLLLQVCVVLPVECIWLFFSVSPQVSFYLWMAIVIGLAAPAGSLIGILDPPLFMRIFPRERYGQFCSANAMWRSISLVVNGVLLGGFFDLLKPWTGEKGTYLWLPVWQWFFTATMLLVAWNLYRSWQRYGGDLHYQPPATDLPTGQLEGDKKEAVLS